MGGGSQDAVDLVALCEEVVGDTCAVLSECCHPGAEFDAFECRRTQLDACFRLLGLEATGSDLSVYDRSAAQACLRPLTECPTDYVLPDPYGYDPYGGSTPSLFIDPNDAAQVQACSRVQSGQRPLGSACSSSDECVATTGSGYSECYYSPQRGQGVCARAVFSSDGTCSFDPDTLVHTLCPPDEFCRTVDGSGSGAGGGGGVPYPGPYPDPYGPSAPQGSASFVFDGTCVAYRLEGQRCVDTQTGEQWPCAEGLVCNYDYGSERCERLRGEGEPCAGSIGCERGLMCNYARDVCVLDTSPSQDGSSGGPFCYVDPSSQPPPACGDGICARSEDPYICPVDCAVCGDYQCTGDEPNWCPEDCGYIMPPYPPGYCGDGICEPGEEITCRGDCLYSGCEPFDVCMQAQPDQPACVSEAACVCDFCSCQRLDCASTPGCLAIAECIETSGCFDVYECELPCGTEIAIAGGLGSPGAFLASELMICRSSAGCPSCDGPPPAVDAGSASTPPDAGIVDGG